MDTSVIFLAAVVLIVWNIIVFAMYAADKRKATKNKWRISEATLVACAFFMGGIGALFGMKILRHKTQHIKFKLLVPLALVLNVAVVVLLVIFIR